MRLVVLIVSSMTVVGHSRAADDVSAANPIRSTIDVLLQQLDSPKLAERSHAEKNLLDLGPEALVFLPAPDLTPSAAVRESVKRVRIQLERRAARESAQASRVQLIDDVTVAQLLKEFAAQTRNRVELSERSADLANQTIHVEFENQPFWECLDQICDRLKLEHVYNLQRGALSLRPRTAGNGIDGQVSDSSVVQRTGPLRVVVRSAETRPILGDSKNRLIRVSTFVTLEPRLRPLFLHFAAIDLQALDATGNLLAPWNSEAKYELPVGNAGRDVPIQLDYLLPVENDSTTMEVRGRLSIQLAAGTERIVFDQTAQSPGASRRRGGVTVRLREVKFEPQDDRSLNAEIGVAVTYDTGGPAFESHRTWIFHNAVYLEDASRRKVDFADYDTAQQKNGAIAVDYRWEKLPAPATQYQFVYEAPTLILDLPLELKLEKIAISRPKMD